MTPLATIQRPDMKGRMALYWHGDGIWCRDPDGTERDTETPCCLRDAIRTIRSTWSQGWDLLFRDLTWIEMISGIIQGYDLEADPVKVRREMKKHHNLDELLCADFIDAVRQAAGE